MCSKSFIYNQFKNINIELDENQINQFYDFYQMIVEKNKVVNLTAITEFEDVVIKHFVDSVLIAKIEDISKKLELNHFFNDQLSDDDHHKLVQNSTVNVIDVGTGAGFPGIPLKIVYPHIHITLLDSLNKRIQFLNDVVCQLGLKDVSCIHGRAEDYGSDFAYREQYDLCVSRAVANLSTLSEYCVPFIKVGGSFISYKSAGVSDEVKHVKDAMKKLNCTIDDVKNLELIHKEEVYQRNFVIIVKNKKLDKKYPRKAGVPSRNPL